MTSTGKSINITLEAFINEHYETYFYNEFYFANQANQKHFFVFIFLT